MLHYIIAQQKLGKNISDLSFGRLNFFLIFKDGWKKPDKIEIAHNP